MLKNKVVFSGDKREIRWENRRIKEKVIFSRRMVVSAKVTENIVFLFYLILLVVDKRLRFW